jgi:hypothetical protein
LKRVLDTIMNAGDETLLLLHQALAWVDDTALFASVEYRNASAYRSKVLAKLHKDRLIEYNKVQKRARISPKGSAYVDKDIVAPRVSKLGPILIGAETQEDTSALGHSFDGRMIASPRCRYWVAFPMSALPR